MSLDLNQYRRLTRVHRAVREHLVPLRCTNRHRPSRHSGHTECVLHTQVTSYYSNFQSIRYKHTQQIASDEPSVMMGIDWPDDGYWSSQMRCHHTESKVNGITRIWIEDGHFDRVRGTKKCCDLIRMSPAFAAVFLPRGLTEHHRDLIWRGDGGKQIVLSLTNPQSSSQLDEPAT